MSLVTRAEQLGRTLSRLLLVQCCPNTLGIDRTVLGQFDQCRLDIVDGVAAR